MYSGLVMHADVVDNCQFGQQPTCHVSTHLSVHCLEQGRRRLHTKKHSDATLGRRQNPTPLYQQEWQLKG
jgi:hypothetical protein